MRELKLKHNWQWKAQVIGVLLAAASVKFYYSNASVNELRWILAPTASLVELITGTRFAFESHAGYMSSDYTFLIAASCAGVNFLITAFLMLALWELWRKREAGVSWNYFAAVALIAYGTTIVANTTRIAIALQLRKTPVEIGLSAAQLHRFEGIVVYFGFLTLLFFVGDYVSRKSSHQGRGITSLAKSSSSGQTSSLNRFGFWLRLLFPMVVYYAVTLGIPLANGAFRKEAYFAEHTVFVLLTPLLVMLPVILWRVITACRRMWGAAGFPE